MTTIDTITTAQIKTLRTEAAEAGDSTMVYVCDRALDESDETLTEDDIMSARAVCVRVIRAAEAMA